MNGRGSINFDPYYQISNFIKNQISELFWVSSFLESSSYQIGVLYSHITISHKHTHKWEIDDNLAYFVDSNRQLAIIIMKIQVT